MFTLLKRISNDGAPSMINEVSFHPSGEMFGATYEYNDEVRIYDARTLSVIRVFRNPGATLNRPHGMLLTEKHLIVANKAPFPAEFRIFRLDDDSGTPTQSYTTPFPHLAAGHSIALHGNRLVVTYCEGPGKEGALVSYDYDDENGRIIGPLDIQERWFSPYGDAKGLSYNEAGDRVYVTIQSELMGWRRKAIRRLKNAVSFGRRGGSSRNGIAVFGIDREGRFTRKPLWKKITRRFCRLENVDIRGNYAVVTDAEGGCVLLYDLKRDDRFETPLQVIRESFVFPHGVKLSPDGNLLVVADGGIETIDHDPQWRTFVSPRMDHLAVFKLQSA